MVNRMSFGFLESKVPVIPACACHVAVRFFNLLWDGQYVFESRKDSIGGVSFELWYACVMRVAQQAVSKVREDRRGRDSFGKFFFRLILGMPLFYRDFDRDGDDEIGKFEVDVLIARE